MLSINQIKNLAYIGNVKIKFCDGLPIAISNSKDKPIKFPCEELKDLLKLKDLRFDWLLGKNNFIAGGAVLNWIWGEQTNEDTDFFFRNLDSTDMFKLFIESIGFVQVNSTGYAITFFEPLTGAVIQTIGRPDDLMSSNFVAYGDPESVIRNFDFHVCKFAIDQDYLYTTTQAIIDLLRLTIEFAGAQKGNNFLLKKRVLKYNKKGFFLSQNITRMIELNTSGLNSAGFPIYSDIGESQW